MLRAPVASRARPCDAAGVSKDRPLIPPARATQFVVSEDEHGTPTLDVVESTFEQTYRVGEHHSVALFLALSRKKASPLVRNDPGLLARNDPPRRSLRVMAA